MSDKIKIKFQQTIHALDVLAYNQRLLRDNLNEDDLLMWVKRYVDQRKLIKQLENQLKCVVSKTKSQSQQIHDQRKRRLDSSHRAMRLHKTLGEIYDLVNYRGQHTSPIDQLHYIKKLCEDKLREDKSFLSDEDDDDDDEIDSQNCTIDDDDQNESLIVHPRVVLSQTSTKNHLLHHTNERISQETIVPIKRSRQDEKQEFVTKTTIDCYNTTRPFTITTDIKVIDNSSTMNSTKTESTSSIEQSLPLNITTPSKLPTIVTHRFVSKKIFKPESCFVCLKRINFGSLSYRCSYCSQSSHADCKTRADTNCKSASNKAMLPPYSPKTPLIPTLNSAHRQRMVSSEPRKTILSSSHTSTIQRRLPFERIILLK
ncbi:unnamed protein product [Adineta ricciae]|uniref:Phorbol-ester/DAG-type domain-containing protein n=1 Tax=Adineta ricciae TaxID=249248 RepID=A0A814CEB7_ADIRI|nr:unnamed protein product [Adineta ricciae]